VLLPLVALAGACGSQAADSSTVALQGGTFLMGSTVGCNDSAGVACAGDRTPHKVRISPFAVDATEVTQRQYAACVGAGACASDGAQFAAGDDTPVLVDDPDLARKYCAARAKAMRLPTEAEFELAARLAPNGSLSTYPWGEDPPSCARVPLAGCDETTPRPVGSSPGDVSALGVHDLGGSVPEWVEDSYSPYVGCADHLSYGELCWGDGNGCADDRCAGDGKACVRGCLPEPGVLSSSTGGSAMSPVCPAAPDAAQAIDPVTRGGPFNVIRGGGPSDGACAFAAFSRRYAAPKSYAAGFRCARSGDLGPRNGSPTYRFSVGNCPPDGRLRVKAAVADGAAAAFTLDWFPSSASGVQSATATMGEVDDVPCDAVMVVWPPATTSLTIQVNTSGQANCLGATKTVTLDKGDTPSPGLDAIPLAAANDCG